MYNDSIIHCINVLKKTDGFEFKFIFSLTVFFRPLVASDANLLLVVSSLSPSPLAVSAVEQLPPLVVYALSPKRWGVRLPIY